MMNHPHCFHLRIVSVLALAIAGCGGAIGDTRDGRTSDVGGPPDDGEPARTTPPATTPQPSTAPSTPLPDPDPSTRVTVASKVDANWIAVDDAHVYFASFLSIARVPKGGGAVEHLADQTFMYAGSELALSPTSIVFAQGMGLATMPKSGGPAVTLVPPTLASYAGAIAADGDGFVAQTGELVIRCDDGQPCTSEWIQGSGLRNVAMDADWLYFRRPTPGHLESLVRAPRRGGAPGAYDVLADDVGVYGFVVVDDSHVYFEKPIDATSSRNAVISIAKAPGGSPVVLAVNDTGFAGGLVDEHWVYWMQNTRVLAIRKDGSSATPIVIGTGAKGNAPATDGSRVYWSGLDGSIYATAVPESP